MSTHDQPKLGRKLQSGEQFAELNTNNIHGKPVSVPDADGRLSHVQFRRFAGCPVCNLHLQTFVARNRDIEEAGIQELVLFHSANDELLPYHGSFRLM